MIGPIFFLLVQVSLEKGMRNGASVAFGATFSDLIILILVFIGMLQVSLDDSITKVWGMMGMLLLFGMGLLMILKPTNLDAPEKGQDLNSSLAANFWKGFLINSFNPLVIIFWIGVVGFISRKYDHNLNSFSYFTAGLMIILFLTDVLKAYFAKRIKSMLQASVLRKIQFAMGCIFILYSLQILYRIV